MSNDKITSPDYVRSVNRFFDQFEKEIRESDIDGRKNKMNDKHKAAMLYAYGVGYETSEIKVAAVKYGWDAALTAVCTMLGGMMPIGTKTACAQHRMEVLSEVAERVRNLHYDSGTIEPALNAMIVDDIEEPKP
jgi:hypothetical protein